MNTRTETGLRIGMAALFVLVGVGGALLARDFTDVGRWFPFYASLGIACMAATVLVQEIVAARRPAEADDGTGAGAVTDDASEADAEPTLRTNLLWWLAVAAFAATVYVVGLFVAAPAFVALALRYGAKVRWRNCALAALIILGAVYGISEILSLPMPEGLLW